MPSVVVPPMPTKDVWWDLPARWDFREQDQYTNRTEEEGMMDFQAEIRNSLWSLQERQEDEIGLLQEVMTGILKLLQGQRRDRVKPSLYGTGVEKIRRNSLMVPTAHGPHLTVSYHVPNGNNNNNSNNHHHHHGPGGNGHGNNNHGGHGGAGVLPLSPGRHNREMTSMEVQASYASKTLGRTDSLSSKSEALQPYYRGAAGRRYSHHSHHSQSRPATRNSLSGSRAVLSQAPSTASSKVGTISASNSFSTREKGSFDQRRQQENSSSAITLGSGSGSDARNAFDDSASDPADEHGEDAGLESEAERRLGAYVGLSVARRLAFAKSASSLNVGANNNANNNGNNGNASRPPLGMEHIQRETSWESTVKTSVDLSSSQNLQSFDVPLDEAPTPQDGAADHPSYDRRDTRNSSQRVAFESDVSPTRSATAQHIWRFLEDGSSSFWAHVYAQVMMAIIISGVAVSFADLLVPGINVGKIISLVLQIILAIELVVRFLVCPSRPRFMRNPFNLFDSFATVTVVPLTILTLTEVVSESYALTMQVFFPALMMLRLLRRFKTFLLLVSAFNVALEALPVLLYTLLLIILMFGAGLYVVEPASNISSWSDAVWLTIATISTVGYGDIFAVTTAGKCVTSALIVVGALYMAIPIGIVGNAFSKVWEDRERLLILQHMRDSVDWAGYKKDDLLRMFEVLDVNGDNQLTFEEFKELLSLMQIDATDEAMYQVFQTFDDDGEGSIDFTEFLLGVYPSSFIISRKNVHRPTRSSQNMGSVSSM